MQRIYDMECNRCKGIYTTADRGELTLYVSNVGLSVCPKCTKEIGALMGYDEKGIRDALSGMKEAETKNNRIKRKEDGTVCNKCEKKFGWTEARVRESSASNVESWHIDCYA